MWNHLLLVMLTSGFSAISVDGFGKFEYVELRSPERKNGVSPFLLMLWVRINHIMQSVAHTVDFSEGAARCTCCATDFSYQSSMIA